MVRHHHRPEAAARTEGGGAAGRRGDRKKRRGGWADGLQDHRLATLQLRLLEFGKIYWTATAVVIVFALVFVFPLYWMVTGAMKTGEEVAQMPPPCSRSRRTSACSRTPETLRHRDAAQEHRLLRRRCLAVRARRGRLRRRAVKHGRCAGT